MKAPLANLTLLWYHCIIQPFFAIDISNPPGKISAKIFENEINIFLIRYDRSKNDSQTKYRQISSIDIIYLFSRTCRTYRSKFEDFQIRSIDC